MTVQTRDQSAPRTLARRRILALGAAGLATAALAACGGATPATASSASGTVNAAGSTVQSAATQVAGTAPGTASTAAAGASQIPAAAGGLLGTAQAVATQNPGVGSTIQAAGGTAQAAVTQASGSAPAAAGTAGAAGSTAGAAGSTAAATSAMTAAGGDPASRNNKYAGKPPPLTIDKTKKYFATIVTNKGTMKAELYADTAPLSVNNFIFLANDHFYDGVIFHRIVKGFVIQGGDPTGMGTGGPGYKFNDEQSSFTRSYEKGTLAMANSGPNTNGSQFFICLDNLTASNKLPKQYNIFGKVTDGLDVVDKIAATPTTRGATGENSMPTEKVFMQSVTISQQ